MKNKKRNKKLDGKMIGPFYISDRKGPVNYQLTLPPNTKTHNVFHVSLLEPAHPDTPVQISWNYEPDDELEYEVKRILEIRGQRALVA